MLNLVFFNQNPDFVQISWVITIIFIKVTGIYANHIIRRDEVLFKSLDGNFLFSVTSWRCNKMLIYDIICMKYFAGRSLVIYKSGL